MTFFFAFSVAGFLALGFAALAFRYARTICLHLLAFYVFFVVLPLAAAWLYTGKVNSRALIGQDLYSFDLADALVAHAHLYALYGAGAFAVGFLFRDGALVRDIARTLAAQRFKIVWPVLFAAALFVEISIKLSFGTLIAGSGDATRILAMPYYATSLLSVLGTLNFGLFAYLAVLSARRRWLLVACLAYVPYVLATDGRRAMLTALVTFFVLRGLAFGFRPNFRLARIGGAALAIFILIGPIFIEARAVSLYLQARGTPPVAALAEGVSRAVGGLLRGDTGFQRVATNVAERGNAGVFFLAVASRAPEKQHGKLTAASILWAIPSVFVEKPPLQSEAMIQLVANMRVLDDANSVPLVLYVDFGPLGMLLAGAVTALLLYAIAKLLAHGRPFGIFHVALLGSFFALSFGIEKEFASVFVELRNAALFAPATLIAMLFSTSRRGRAALRPPPSPRPATSSRCG
jgi:hypothetical protein